MEYPRQQRRSRRGCIFSLIALCLVVAVGIVGYNVIRSQFQTSSGCPTGKLVLNMYYGSEKEAWINAVVSDYNSHNSSVCIDAVPIGSGQSMQEIVAGTIQPDIWSPAGSVWLALLNSIWQQKHGSNLISTGANDTPSLVTSPVVIAMWKPEAEALGWPNKAIGWADITDPKTKAFVTNVESSVIHYGDSTGFFADKMFSKGPSYLSATVMYESLVVQANDGKTYPHLAYPVVAIYPKEGTFYSDHPFAIPQASWVTAQKRAA